VTDVHLVDNLCFVDPVTPQTLEAALEIKEVGKEHEEDLFENMDLGAWVFLLYFICYVVSSVVILHIRFLLCKASTSNSEPESPVESISSAQTHMSPSERRAFKMC